MVLVWWRGARGACVSLGGGHASCMTGKEEIESLQREMRERGELEALLARWAESLSDEERAEALAIFDPDGIREVQEPENEG